MSDAELVDRARTGDAEAFGELVDRHRAAVYRAALVALRRPDEADDVAQDVFIAAFRRLGSFRGEASFRTWLLAITWRKALDRRMHPGFIWRSIRAARVGAASDDPPPLEETVSTAATQEQALLGAELADAIRRLVGKLKPTLRDTLLLAGSGEYTYEEAAEMLGVPVGTVKWRVSEARRQLRHSLARLGYGHE